MIDWFAGAVESAKAMKEIGQSLLTIRDEGIIRERVYELNNSLMDLQQKLLEAQLNQMELVKRIQALESEREQANQSKDVMAQYTLKNFQTGVSAYILNGEADAESPQLFCTSCLETASVAVTLQGARVKTCPKCRSSISTAPRPQITVRNRTQLW
ncbi:hypothetical protein PF66_02267 [Pseudomonas asplenii]|uniref:Uncharacterized protein n=1 Tax=Pseudomonas asplenii TaxID=53407 RepID=A0A0M9GHI5_9PSED|nr:hypothetical protein [Pseudomonas fuscovaginae]KPA91384.1 hypothetical protein PF66_02267 [Pseudomonas fuscovaginae]